MSDLYADSVTTLSSLIAQAASSASDFDIKALCRSSRAMGRTGVMFFKPEVVNFGSEGLAEAVRYLLLVARDHGIHIRTAHVVKGRVALRRRYIQKNYQFIHCAALHVSSAQAGPNHMDESSRWPWPRLGALRLRGTGHGSTRLLSIWRAGIDNVRKLGNDCYGLPITLADRTFVLLNGFYPYQLTSYAAPRSKLVVFTFDASSPLERLKQEFQGDADPRVASMWSVRARLRQISQGIGGPEIWTSQNGFHMSANTREGSHELNVFANCFPEVLC